MMKRLSSTKFTLHLHSHSKFSLVQKTEENTSYLKRINRKLLTMDQDSKYKRVLENSTFIKEIVQTKSKEEWLQTQVLVLEYQQNKLVTVTTMFDTKSLTSADNVVTKTVESPDYEEVLKVLHLKEVNAKKDRQAEMNQDQAPAQGDGDQNAGVDMEEERHGVGARNARGPEAERPAATLRNGENPEEEAMEHGDVGGNGNLEVDSDPEWQEAIQRATLALKGKLTTKNKKKKKTKDQ